MKNLAGGIITNTLSSQTAEFLGNLISGILYFFLGPKLAFFTMYTFSAIGSISLLLATLGGYKSVIVVCVFIAKFGISAAFNMSFIALVQLTPTAVATTSFGLANFVARLVTFLAPMTAEMNEITGLIINISCALFAAFVSLLLVTRLPRFV